MQSCNDGKEMYRSVTHVQSCCVVNINILFFCRSRCRRHPEILLPWWRDVTLLLSIGHIHDDVIWLHLPEFISICLRFQSQLYIFLSRRSTTTTWNFLISRVRFINLVNTTQCFFFPFVNSNSVLSDLTPKNLANIWQINWNRTRSMNSKTVLSDVFRFVVIQKFCYLCNVT